MIQEKDSKPGDKETLGLPAYTPMQQVNYSAPTLSYCLFILFIVVLEKTLESPTDSKEIKPINPKGNQPWISIGRTDAEAEVSIIWPPDEKSRLIGKVPDIGKDWRQEDKGEDRGQDGWMASPTRLNWVWANSRRWWRTGKPGVLQSMGSQRVRHGWVTVQQQYVNNGRNWVRDTG